MYRIHIQYLISFSENMNFLLFDRIFINTGLTLKNLKLGVHVCVVVSNSLLLRSFNGPEPGGLELTDKKVKEKEADIPWFMQKANKAPTRGLLCSRRPQVPSPWGEGAECLQAPEGK